jgi:hypothetical protein
MDLTDMACMFWHTGIAPYSVESDENYPDGPGVLHPGSTETFTRSSKAWMVKVNAGNIGIEFANNIKRIGPDGVLIEGAATNYIINSAFINGFTGWTAGGSGTTALDTTITFFEDAVASAHAGTNQTAKLTYVDGVGGASRRRTTVQSFGAFDWLVLSIWYMDDNASYPARYHIVNTTTGNYYNASGAGSWQAGAIANVLPSRTGNFGKSDVVFSNDSSASTLTIAVYSPTSPGGGDQFTNIGQVQLEWTSSHQGQDRGSSPIPTYDATITRAVENWKWSNDLGRRVFPVEAGTIIVRVKWHWDGPNTSQTAMTTTEDGIPLLLAYHDANNWAYLCFNYSGSSITIRFGYKGAGTLTTAFSDLGGFSFSDGDVSIIAARWVSSNGELGLTARTMNVFIDGVKGPDYVRTTDMVEVDSSALLNIGTPEAGYGGNVGLPEPLASFSHIEILPFPLSDGEIQARS